MAIYLLRLWLPDRPGALGQVAGRIGAVRADVVGIDILERGRGRAMDEFTVDLPDAGLLKLLVSEICEVDGVEVEDVRPMRGEIPDPRLDALETAMHLAEQPTVRALLDALVARVVHDFAADWASVVEVAGKEPLAFASDQAPPTEPVISSSERKVSEPSGGGGGPQTPAQSEDAACVVLDQSELEIHVGRRGRPFREREHRQLGALAAVAGHRWTELLSQRQAGVRQGIG